MAGRSVPVEPRRFLRVLFENTRQSAQRLGGMTFAEVDEEVFEEVDEVVTRKTEHADTIDELLDASDESRFSVLSTTLTRNYARDINHLRRLEARAGDELPAAVCERIDDLVHRL